MMKDCNMYIPTYEDMLAAHDRIEPIIRRTPVRTSDYLNELSGAQLFFKCENFQEPGAFKVRGGSNAALTHWQIDLRDRDRCGTASRTTSARTLSNLPWSTKT